MVYHGLAWFIGRYFQINETITIRCEFSAVSVALNVPRMVFTLHLVVREAAAKWVAGTKGKQGDITGGAIYKFLSLPLLHKFASDQVLHNWDTVACVFATTLHLQLKFDNCQLACKFGPNLC